MRKIFALSLFLTLLGCADESPSTRGPRIPRAEPFSLSSQDRDLRDLPAQLRDQSLPAPSVLYEGPQYSIWVMHVPGRQALETWRKLRGIVDRTGAWPVLAGPPEGMDDPLREILQESDDDLTRLINKGLDLDAEAWLARRAAEAPEIYDFPREPLLKRLFSPPKIPPNQDFWIVKDLTTQNPHEVVSILLVPTRNGWEVPGFLEYGGWNDCPEPAAHIAMLRRWNVLHGAELVSLGPDTVELSIGRPLRDRQAALGIAREQFIYAYDIVHQGTTTLDRLADEITGASVWFFWWD